eukprot:7304463-Prymnesium_polylepis.1
MLLFSSRVSFSVIDHGSSGCCTATGPAACEARSNPRRFAAEERVPQPSQARPCARFWVPGLVTQA